jgi:hypothetical protein
MSIIPDQNEDAIQEPTTGATPSGASLQEATTGALQEPTTGDSSLQEPTTVE